MINKILQHKSIKLLDLFAYSNFKTENLLENSSINHRILKLIIKRRANPCKFKQMSMAS